MKKRWQLVSLLFLASIINYLDRAALGIAAPLVAQDLDLSPSELGMVFSSFFVGYALFCFVGGWASDRIGAKRVIAIAMVFWSIFCGMTAFAVGFASLLVFRLLFGIGEGPLVSSTNKVLNSWFPHKEVATAVGVTFSGTPLGGALAGPIVGFAAIQFGWRVAFVVIGLLGFLWLAAWLRFAADTPSQHRTISSAELAEIESDRPPIVEPAALPLKHYFRRPAVLATALAFFAYNYILFFFLTWFPSYLATEHELSIQSMSIASVLPWCMGVLGLASGGFVSDFLLRRTGRPVFARKILLAICLTLTGICVALAGLVLTPVSAVALMSVAVFFLYLSGTSYWAILQDTVHGSAIGGVGGFVHMIATSAGIIGPALTGFLVAITGTFASSFVFAGSIALAGVLVVLVFVREPPTVAGVAARPAGELA